MYYDLNLLLFIAPALILGLWAQLRIKTTYAAAQRMPAPLSGAAAARHILDSAGLQNVDIEQIPGHLSDHYDPRHKVLRLSPEIYQSRSLAAVGIAAHEAGHALQDAKAYAPLVIRNIAVPVAGFGSGAGMLMLILGLVFHWLPLLGLGIVVFSGFVFFQIINLPVEYNASHRAKAQLATLGIVSPEEMVYVNKVLNAAALTYVAATLQAILTLLYYVMIFSSGNRR
ncbi:MAG TPA: zinc metallopeptidase [Thermoguttaceae bacterium]|nr:zinc metallopeptidase [Thermoguttaceae bacterium]